VLTASVIVVVLVFNETSVSWQCQEKRLLLGGISSIAKQYSIYEQ
jgi:hypothetical protein